MSEATISNDEIMKLIEQIYSSTLIPKSHKDAYVDHIRDQGLSEKMLSELEKIFNEEASGLESSIEERRQLVAQLESQLSQLQSENEMTQSQMLAAYQQANEKAVEEMEDEVEEAIQDFEALSEVLKEGSEQESIEALQSKIKNQ